MTVIRCLNFHTVVFIGKQLYFKAKQGLNKDNLSFYQVFFYPPPSSEFNLYLYQGTDAYFQVFPTKDFLLRNLNAHQLG